MTKPVTDPKELTNIYKKNGTFDKQRRQLLEDFKASETHSNLRLKLKVMMENKVKQDPTILMRNKGKMAALIQGEILGSTRRGSQVEGIETKDENSLLSIVDKDIQEKLIDSPEFHNIVRAEIRDIKRKIEGVSDEDFALLLEKEKQEQKRQEEIRQEKLSEKLQEERHKFDKRPRHKITKAPRFNLRPGSDRSERGSGSDRGQERNGGNDRGERGGERSGDRGDRGDRSGDSFHLMY